MKNVVKLLLVAMMVATLSLVSCKKNEAPATEAVPAVEAPAEEVTTEATEEAAPVEATEEVVAEEAPAVEVAE